MIAREDVSRIVEALGDGLRPMSGSTLLVTGSNGFLCGYFLDAIAHANDVLLEKPCRVIAMDNFQTGLPERLEHLRDREEIEFVQQDVSLPVQVSRPIDWIIHGASIASPTAYRRMPLETIDVNVNGTRQLLELARRGARSMLYLSTSEIYGDPDPASIPTSEEYRGSVSCTGPRACYDESKRLAETLCTTYHRLYGVPVKIVRPFNVYGPGQRLDDGRIIPDLMAAALKGQPLVLYSSGHDTRAFCYVTDAIIAMWRVLLSDADGEVFNVGNGDEETTILDLAERMRQAAGPPMLDIELAASEEPDYLTDSPKRRCPDVSKLRARFEWEPQVPVADGLRRTLQSYRETAAVKG